MNISPMKDNYPIPLIEETLDTLKGAQFFTSLDLESGYWQIGLRKLAKHKTAFIFQKGLFQFEVLPFGSLYPIAQKYQFYFHPAP
jgi:hypothetical protein